MDILHEGLKIDGHLGWAELRVVVANWAGRNGTLPVMPSPTANSKQDEDAIGRRPSSTILRDKKGPSVPCGLRFKHGQARDANAGLMMPLR